MMLPEVAKEKIQVKISEIQFVPEFYARLESDQKLIADYEENITEILKGIECAHISQDNILIDGYHRWKAAERVFGKDALINVVKHMTDDKNYILLESYAANNKNGKRNSRAENVRNVRALYVRGFNLDQIQEKLSLSKSLVYSATTDDRKREKEERNQKIIDLYLKAENTLEAISELVNVPVKTIHDAVKNCENSTLGNFAKDFKPILYTVWNTPKGDDNTNHFGAFPAVFMENLLHYHTQPLDIVFDPFGGGGTTVDVCKRMFRRYYVSDRKVKPGRENDIKEHDISNGLPDDLPKPAFVFLDPPYWKQALNKYSIDADDLGNMSLEIFNKSMSNLLNELKLRKIKNIAIVIQPTSYSNDFKLVDHSFDFYDMLKDKYKITARYILPYSTQQYNAQMVEKAKEKNIALVNHRDLIVYEVI